MLVTLRRPAPLAELAAMLAPGLKGGGLDAKGLGPFEIAARHQLLTRSCGFHDSAGHCLACGGIYDAGDGRLEAWFACRPQARAAIRSIVTQLRLTLRLIVETERVEIHAKVAAGWTPGQRLAKAMGFELAESGPVERWRLCPTSSETC